MTPPVACQGHQELRDMVIELRADVKHIDNKICNLVEIAKTNSVRIDALETYRDEAVGRAKGVASTSTLVSVAVSIVVSFFAVIVSWVVR